MGHPNGDGSLQAQLTLNGSMHRQHLQFSRYEVDNQGRTDKSEKQTTKMWSLMVSEGWGEERILKSDKFEIELALNFKFSVKVCF